MSNRPISAPGPGEWRTKMTLRRLCTLAPVLALALAAGNVARRCDMSTSGERLQVFQQAPESDRPKASAQRKAVLPRMDHVQALELQVLHGDPHGFGERRCLGVLEFESVAPAAVDHKQIELGAGVSGPEVALVGARAETCDYLAEREAFPGGAQARMALQFFPGFDLEQGVKEPGIAEKDFGGFDLTFGQIFPPGRKHAHQERADQY